MIPLPARSTRQGWADMDPACRASALLVESLIHGLIENGALTTGEAMDIVLSATDVEQEIAAEDPTPTVGQSAQLSWLQLLHSSLSGDAQVN
jgi:hypothetical protein